MLLSDRAIKSLAVTRNMINPFSLSSLNSYGYDLILADEFLIPSWDAPTPIIDPFDPPEFSPRKVTDCLVIPPGSFALGRSVEYIRMPGDVTGICLGRSTYARSGVLSHVTPLEAGWHGTVTIEISNTNHLPVKVWAHRGITQVLFFAGNEPPERDYVAKGGRYQGQRGVTQGRGGS